MSEPAGEQTIGRYRIVRPLGMGAMGKVYLAEDPRIERLLAIKTVRVEGREGEVEDRKRRLLREAKAAGKLIHPHVVTLFDAGEDGETLFLAFEYVKGSDLSGRLEQGPPFTLAEALRVVRQAAEGLAYAHQQGIVHRDIKPSNILLDERSWVKISDFGIAKMAGQATELTMTGSVVGSPHYLSPEQIRGEDLDGRSDLFSLGVVLYELLSRKRPFEAETLTSLIYQILHQEPPPLAAAQGEIARRLDEIVRRLMAKDKDERFATAGEVASAIAALEQSLPGEVLSVPAATFLGPVPTAPITRAGMAPPPPPASAVAPPPVAPPPPPASGPQPAVFGGAAPPPLAPGLPPPPPVAAVSKKKSPLALIGIALAACVLALVVVGVFVFQKLKPTGTPPAEQEVSQTEATPGEPSTSSGPESNSGSGREANPAANPVASGKLSTSPSPRPGELRPAGVRIIEGPGAEPVARPQTSGPGPTSSAGQRNETATPPAPTAGPTSPSGGVPAQTVPSGPQARPEPEPEADEPVEERPRPSADRALDTGMVIRMQVEPEDAFVLVDRRLIGRASELKGGYTLPDPGEHLLVVRKEGMQDARVLLRASTSLGATQVPIRLRHLAGDRAADSDLAIVRVAEGVGFKVDPKTARVLVDGSDRGTASQYGGFGRWLKLPQGRHRISLTAPGFQQVDFLVEVAPGTDEDHHRFQVQLPKSGG